MGKTKLKIDNFSENQKTNIPWYSLSGPFDDVILSTRVRICRNLADFPFAIKMKMEDFERINSLFYDAFQKNPDFYYIPWNSISETGRKILKDKNIIKNLKKYYCSAVVMNNDDCTSAVINETDHIKISSFTAGFDIEKAMQKVYKIDEYLQSQLQFASSYEFGYLTSRIKDCGTGMKISLRIFIPGIILQGHLGDFKNLVSEKKFVLHQISGDCSGFYDIAPSCACVGTEIDQLAEMQAFGMQIIKAERKFRRQSVDNNFESLLNVVKHDFSIVMSKYLLWYDRVLSIVGALKYGLQAGFVSGILENELNSLIFSTKDGQLLYLMDNYDFSFEEDIRSNKESQILRLRAVVIQQALENVKIASKN